MQVCESTEIVYDKNVVNFSANDSVPARLQEACTRLSLIYFCSSLFAGWVLVGMCYWSVYPYLTCTPLTLME